MKPHRIVLVADQTFILHAKPETQQRVAVPKLMVASETANGGRFKAPENADRRTYVTLQLGLDTRQLNFYLYLEP